MSSRYSSQQFYSRQQMSAMYQPQIDNYSSLIIKLVDDEIVFEETTSSTYDSINYSNNTLYYNYDPVKEKITDDLKNDLVKLLYHKINSEIIAEQEKIDKKKSKLSAFKKWLRGDKLKRLIIGEK